MKHRLWISFLFTLLILGCNQEEVLRNGQSPTDGRVFTTSFENDESRTYLENGYQSHWTADDRISVFDGSTLNSLYCFGGETGDRSGSFFMVSRPESTGIPLSANYAIYPYDKNMTISQTGVITVTLPEVQHYAENTFGLGANTMVAVTEDTDDTFLKFKNVGSCLKMKLYGDDVTVKSITLKGLNGEKISGKANIIAAYDKVPVLSMANDATYIITLDCGEKGVKIGSTSEDATAFWMVLPPTTFTYGFTITVEDINGRQSLYAPTDPILFERNMVKQFTIKVKPKEVSHEIPYVTFTANAPQTLTMSKAVETLQYSVSGGEWKELGTNTVSFGGNHGSLRLRGKSSIGTTVASAGYSKIKFGNEIPVACSGDIRTLVDYDNYQTVDTQNARFCGLFESCTSLIEAPELPATALAKECYYYMFIGCSNLTKAPEILPATTLTLCCYYSMFNGCSSLTKAPKILATTLAQSCCSGMFANCSSLKEAPELPATTLADYCYTGMFNGCSQLNSITMLATNISASGCLSNWVNGVAPTGTFTKTTSMTSLPIGVDGIPVGWTINNVGEPISDIIPYITFIANSTQTLTMSYAVETLEYSVGDGEWKTLGTTTVEFGAHLGDLRLRGKNPAGTAGVTHPASTIKFGTEIPVSCKGDIRTLLDYENYTTVATGNARFTRLFEGCKVLRHAPELPATTLATNCYKNMFYGCRQLRQAPSLPSLTLTQSCYEWMFADCDNLIEAPTLPATTLAENCYSFMFAGCSSLTTTPKLPAIILAKGCYSNMFSKCNGLTHASDMDAEVLAVNCCYSMFSDCFNLVQAPALPATVLAEGCYNYMFGYCTSLTIAPELPATTLAANCYYAMFHSCNCLTQAPVLPATTLTEGCYALMFYYCTSLTKSPLLPALALKAKCYYRMFYGCANLNEVTMLAQNHKVTDSMTDWLKGVSSTGTFYKNLIMISNQPLPRGDSGVPTGWTLKDYGSIFD